MDAYARNFTKICRLEELPSDKPKVFRTGGATVILSRLGDAVEAVDGSSREQRALATRVEDGSVWVCLEGCTPA